MSVTSKLIIILTIVLTTGLSSCNGKTVHASPVSSSGEHSNIVPENNTRERSQNVHPPKRPSELIFDAAEAYSSVEPGLDGYEFLLSEKVIVKSDSDEDKTMCFMLSYIIELKGKLAHRVLTYTQEKSLSIDAYNDVYLRQESDFDNYISDNIDGFKNTCFISLKGSPEQISVSDFYSFATNLFIGNKERYLSMRIDDYIARWYYQHETDERLRSLPRSYHPYNDENSNSSFGEVIIDTIPSFNFYGYSASNDDHNLALATSLKITSAISSLQLQIYVCRQLRGYNSQEDIDQALALISNVEKEANKGKFLEMSKLFNITFFSNSEGAEYSMFEIFEKYVRAAKIECRK